MVAIERVICPIDLSPHSARALRHGAAWAKYYDARLHVLHVAPLPQPLVSPTGVFAALPMRPLDDIKAEVNHFVADTLAGDQDAIARATVDVLQGQTATAIVDVSSRPQALLVMGTHGWSGLDRLLIGSVTERVAHLTRCPVLVVPPDARTPPSGGAVRQVLCAIDLRPSSLAGMRYGLSLGQEVKARIELLTVIEGPREGAVRDLVQAILPENDHGRQAALRELRERVPDDARAWCDVQENVIMGPPVEVLLRRARELEADLIVMGTGDRPHLHAAWLGATTGRILREARCPVLIVPAPERVALRDAMSLPMGDWADELSRLSRIHQGERATIAIIRDDLGMEREAFALPFAGMTLERHQGHSRVAIMLTKPDGTRLTHMIADPRMIQLAEARDQSDVEMMITARDGTATLFGVGVRDA
jgi:nucleotide-binding universal stress UspA family protein